MSAALVDEFSFDYAAPAIRAQRAAHRPVTVVAPQAPVRRPAPCDHGVPIVSPARPSWKLTDRGIAVVLTLFVALVLAGAAVLFGAFLSVSDAPLGAAPAAVSGVVSVIGG
jgi:hypothetical protein